MSKKKNIGKSIAKYVVVGVLIFSMVASIFAYLLSALQTI